MRSVRAVLALVRWHNALLAAAGVFVGAWWAGGDPLDARVRLTAAAAIALAAFANITNDLFDVDIDRVAHPERPLPSGALSRALGRRLAAVSGTLALVLSTAVHTRLGVTSGLVLFGMVEYSRWIKRRGFPGNLMVAILASLPFLYGAWSIGRPLAATPLLLLAMPLHLAREVAKDIEDAEGDAPVRRTLPLASGAGVARGVLIAALLAFVAVVTWFAVPRPRFALFVAPALVLCAFAAHCAYVGVRGGPLLLKSAMVWSMGALVASGA